MTDQSDLPPWLNMWTRALSGFSPGSTSTSSTTELNEPINPGWTFGNVINVTETNSSSPATENAIVAADSYGRQLGHVIEALAELIEERPKDRPKSAAMQKLLALNTKIANIKANRIDSRIAEIKTFLEELKKSNTAEYKRVAEELKNALPPDDA